MKHASPGYIDPGGRPAVRRAHVRRVDFTVARVTVNHWGQFQARTCATYPSRGYWQNE